MVDIDQELQKYGLTREQYEACLSDIRAKVNGDNDLEWAEIVDKYGLSVHYDTLRKASQTIFGGAFVTAYFQESGAATYKGKAYLIALQHEKEEIKKERQKLRDEKLEYNRWLREQSRDELICEKVCEAVKALQPLPLPPVIDYAQGDTEGVLFFGDTHFGTEYCIKGLHGEIINEYSPEIFEQRMEELLAQTVVKAQKEGFSKIRVFSLGDEIDGILRVSQLMKLRYGVVEQTIKYAEYICRWLARLTQYVAVDFQMVEGNHSELRMISQPKGTFINDNMSQIVREFIKTKLGDNPNFTMKENPSGLIYDNILGYNLLGIHGEVKNLSNALQAFCNLYNTNLDILVGGHMHHYKSETVGVNKDIISVPSIIGIDDYSVSLLRTSNAGASFIVIERNKGVVDQMTFKFSV